MKIIIIGKGPGWENAPMEGETWGVNNLILRRPVKLSFQVHDIDWQLKYDINQIKDQIKEINRLGIPVIVAKKHKLLPTSIVFPINRMPFEYFTGSISYMIAYAIYKRATEIDLYGISFFLRKEFLIERPCVEFWLGQVMARGMKVTVHDPTTIGCCRPYQDLYGYDKVIKA